MTFFHTLFIAKKILLQKRGRLFFTLFTISIGTCALFLFSSFSKGIEEAVLPLVLEKSSPTSLMVRASFHSFPFLGEKSKILQKDVEEIQKIPHIISTQPQFILGFPNSLRISIFGFTFETDAPVFGMEDESKEDNNESDTIPITISPYLIDVFNSSIIESIPGGHPLTTEDVIGKEIQILFGKSTFLRANLPSLNSLEKTGVIRHISPQVPLIGFSIPFSTALLINKEVGGIEPEDIVYQKIYIEIDDIKHVDIVKKEVEKIGFIVQSQKDLMDEFRSIILMIYVILYFSGIIIFCIALISLVSLVSLSVLEQQKNIGILQVLGAKKSTLFGIFLCISGIISCTGYLFGIIFGVVSSYFINTKLVSVLPKISFLPDSFFPLSISYIIILFFFIVFLSLLASVFPVFSAIKKEPLKSIWTE